MRTRRPNSVMFVHPGGGSVAPCNPQESLGSINSINILSYYGLGVRMLAVSFFQTDQLPMTRGVVHPMVYRGEEMGIHIGDPQP